jgi:hypothetical protein
MNYQWDAIKGTLYCDDGMVIESLPVPSGDDAVYEFRYQDKVISVVVEDVEIDGSIYTLIKSLGNPVFYPVAGAGLFRVAPYDFESLEEEKTIASLLIEPIKFLRPDGTNVCLSPEMQKRLGAGV